MNTIELIKCCRFLSGGTPSKARADYWKGVVPWFSPKDIKTFELCDSQDHISESAILSSATQVVPPNTILVVGRSGVLAHTLPVGIIRTQAAFNQDIKAILPGDDFDPEFVALYLKYQEARVLRLGVKVGATVHSLKSGFLESLKIPLLSIDEQRRIAAHLIAQLTAVEEARQAAQVQLADAQRLVSAILEDSFANLEHAQWVRIGDIARTTSGTTPSRSRKDYWTPAKYPWVKTGEVAFKPISQTGEAISEVALQECSLSLLPAGTILIAMYGQGKTRGQSAVLAVAATTNQACFAILPTNKLDPEYLHFWLWHSYGNLRASSDARGGNQSNLNGAILNAFEVPLLPLDEQKSMAAKVRAAIDAAQNLQRSLEKQLNDIELLPARLLARAFDFVEAPHD